jgi:hypothetical protein
VQQMIRKIRIFADLHFYPPKWQALTPRQRDSEVIHKPILEQKFKFNKTHRFGCTELSGGRNFN